MRSPLGTVQATFLTVARCGARMGTRAGVIVVMAKTLRRGCADKARIKSRLSSWKPLGRAWRSSSAAGSWDLRALYNAVIEFHDVRVPRENVLLAEGKGLRVALSTLNTGRLTLPRRVHRTRQAMPGDQHLVGRKRVQWGKPIGKHAAIASKIADMAAATFAMESMTMLTASLVDRAKSDFRLESAICKMLATEWAWRIANDTMQIRGGRGYETAGFAGQARRVAGSCGTHRSR